MSRERARLGPRNRALLLLAVVVAIVVAVLLIHQSGPKTLGEGETKQLLRELPYRFKFRPAPVPDGASGAVAGLAFGPHSTVLGFGISLGRNGDPVSLGPRTDHTDSTGGETFRATFDDTVFVHGRMETGPRIETAAQAEEAVTMGVAIEEKLCRATEGKPCAI